MSNTEALEVKVAFLEETVTTLNDEFFIQQKELEQIKKQMALLVEKLRGAQNDDQDTAGILDERPPHY